MRRLQIFTALFTFLMTATSAAAQDMPAPDQSQQAVNPSGGWRRVGDPPPPDQPGYPSYSSDQPAYPQSDPNQSPAGPSYAAPQPPLANQQQFPQPAYQQPPYNTNQRPSYPTPSPMPAQLTIPAGTFLTARVNQMLSSDRNAPGDAFSATLVEPIVANGIVVAEPGQTIGGRVVMVQKHGTGNPAKLGVELTTLTLVDGQQVPLRTQLTSRRGGTTPGGVEAGTIVATTGLGAAIGAAANWGRGAAIGAGAGALAGIIGVVLTHNHASVIH
ncbi:MAG: hypothetical protein JO091_08995, partial [Acidobacteriaceae bacterium]|nr:hypothetical protein [Acidobacteriaceae bacterium]